MAIVKGNNWSYPLITGQGTISNGVIDSASRRPAIVKRAQTSIGLSFVSQPNPTVFGNGVVVTPDLNPIVGYGWSVSG